MLFERLVQLIFSLLADFTLSDSTALMCFINSFTNYTMLFVAVAALTHSGAQLNMSQSDSINNRTVNLSFLTVLSSNKLKSPQY